MTDLSPPFRARNLEALKLFGVPPLGGIWKTLHLCFRLKAVLQTVSTTKLFAGDYLSPFPFSFSAPYGGSRENLWHGPGPLHE
jgi:hypothetical protein